MSKKWNRLLCTTIAGVLFLGNIQAYGNVTKLRLLYDGRMHDYEAEDVTITINGSILSVEDMPPIVLYDRTLVPARAVFETLGAEVAWNEATQEVYVRKDEELVVLKADQNIATKNGTSFEMDVPAKVINERTMIPVRAVSEAIGCTVGWDENTRIVSIDEKIEEIIPPENTDNDNNNDNDSSTSNNNTDTKVDEKEYAYGGTGDIPEENIGITDVILPESKSDKQIFTIKASDEIAKFQEVKGNDNEIVIDIYYGQKEILTDHIQVLTSDVVKGVVSSQFNDDDDITITRVVLELTKECEYNIDLDDDDEAIIVSFKNAESSDNNQNIIIDTDTNINTDNNNTTDTNTNTEIDNNTNNNTNNNTDTNTDNNNDKEEDTDKNTSTNTNTNTNINTGTTITTNTHQPNQLKNVYYDSSRKAITLSKLESMDTDDIEHIDDYTNKKYQIILPEDYSKIYGSGTMPLNTSELLSVTVSEENGRTAITFEENGIYAFAISEDAHYYYINIKNPKEVYDKIVVLDAGHGGQDPGTSGNGLDEKDMTLAILQKTYAKLQRTDKVKTYVTRIADTYPENIARAKMANEIGDVFISIHMNSANPNPTPNGTEVLFITHDSDNNRNFTSKAVATVLLKNVVNALETNNRGLKYDTPEQKNLIVLNKTVVPAVIIETLFLSNPGDALKISNETYQEEVAQAIYDSIIELADNYRWR